MSWYKLCLLTENIKMHFFTKMGKYIVCELLRLKTFAELGTSYSSFTMEPMHFQFSILIKLLEKSIFVHEKN